jgi:hypothetical protein
MPQEYDVIACTIAKEDLGRVASCLLFSQGTKCLLNIHRQNLNLFFVEKMNALSSHVYIILTVVLIPTFIAVIFVYNVFRTMLGSWELLDSVLYILYSLKAVRI